ncbi:hypothetical protein I317_01867 [Kwoniella heveanensis CBS 569]|uniref:Uncharacterized protein n=1 Tax=Kwoniella heveanensis BCC8398 TaxID=1296120 RepID=A0A1B9GPX8_9TREE|nr:hypothetical protein I316_05112 [Kwoniella heveanensis BCC8398]OCF44249.1 hypothetical protein I317_01867 [Kwoniella heveanensis CBS 569]
MSISLPNGTILAAPSSSSAQLSAAVTRILHLANFSADLKTRDLQNMFKDWENEKGGFRIKWLDDVNALVVFADASVAKRAYLSLLLHPPPAFSGLIRPYDRPDAAQIIQSLAARALGHRSAGSTALNGSISFPFPSNNEPSAPQVHSRAMSVTNTMAKSGSISIPSGNNIGSSLAGVGSGSSIGGINGGGGGHTRGATAPQRIGGYHQRTSSASSSWGGRPSLGGAAGLSGGVLSFASAPKLPTHSESAMASRSTSESDGEPNVVILDPSATQGWKTGGANGSGFGGGGGAGNANGTGGSKIRRESVSADKAMREVEKALASVEAQG